jgi:hypothetical protein
LLEAGRVRAVAVIDASVVAAGAVGAVGAVRGVASIVRAA